MNASPCPLLHAFRLQDYIVDEWLTSLWASKENADFKAQIAQVPLIQKIKAVLAEQYEEESSSAEETKGPTDEARVQILMQDE